MSTADEYRLGFDLLKFLVERRKDLWDLWQGLPGWFRTKFRGAPQDSSSIPELLIIGPGGVGKSLLASFLADDFSQLAEGRADYTESLRVEEFHLTEPGAAIIVPPGQKRHRDYTWLELEQGIVAGRFSGIMLVCAFGYHSIGQFSYKDLAGYRPGDEQEFLAQHLRRCRQDEIQVVRRLAPLIARAPNRQWLLTVVTKQDLWADSSGRVERHYTTGAFGKALQRALRPIDPARLRLEWAFVSLVNRNFVTGRNELLARTAAGYDWERQAESIKDLLRKLRGLRDWEMSQ